MNFYTKELYLKAISKWGIIAQIMMCNEEFSELTVELSKTFRNGEPDKERLIDEVVDAGIMLEQIKVMFKLDDDRIRERKVEKLKRLEKRLKEEK